VVPHVHAAGGAALFAPDDVRETFRDDTDFMTGQEGEGDGRCVPSSGARWSNTRSCCVTAPK
jgi:hypothetical protein